MKSKANHQLKTILVIHDIQGRKNINVICKDLVSWMTRKQEFEQRNNVFFLNCHVTNSVFSIIRGTQ